MPFEFTNAPSTFMDLMNWFFKGQIDKVIVVIIDDTLWFIPLMVKNINNGELRPSAIEIRGVIWELETILWNEPQKTRKMTNEDWTEWMKAWYQALAQIVEQNLENMDIFNNSF